VPGFWRFWFVLIIGLLWDVSRVFMSRWEGSNFRPNGRASTVCSSAELHRVVPTMSSMRHSASRHNLTSWACGKSGIPVMGHRDMSQCRDTLRRSVPRKARRDSNDSNGRIR